MLITPRPGTNRHNILDALRTIHTAATNERSTRQFTDERLMRYLEWAAEGARRLGNQISAEDLTALILTPRYDAILNGVGHLADMPRLVNLLVDQELADRGQALEAAIDALKDQITRWSGQFWFVVADSSFYIHNPDRLDKADLHHILGLPSDVPIRLLFPIAVVDELDALKESGKQRARWRASHTLGVLDRTLNGSTEGVLHPERLNVDTGRAYGEVSMEIILDPPGHTRLPITDDEIIERAVVYKALADRDVRLLTCDTGQHTRGRAAGLTVTKVPAKDPGPEPDWTAQDKPGNGTRARRARQNESATPPAGA